MSSSASHRNSHQSEYHGGKCKSIAVLGTMSDAGKSIIAAGLCRVLANGGTRVAPFKAQNMSNNSAPALLPDPERREELYQIFRLVAGETSPEIQSLDFDTGKEINNKFVQGYGEIGVAQGIQSEACRLIPRVEMNPILLKSGGRNDAGEYLCSLIVMGKQVARETYGDLGLRTVSLRSIVLKAHESLVDATGCEVVVLEGAGSCTELNLMDRDIVNLPLVKVLRCPWLLVANIDCGGVFAQIIGTKACVTERDWDLCVGIVVNKLRGELAYFEPGPLIIQDLVGKPVFVVPFLNDLNIPEEDGVGVDRRLANERYHDAETQDSSNSSWKPIVVVVAYPYISMTEDLTPLQGDDRFKVEWRRRCIPKRYPYTSAVILPGSRLTRCDLKWLHDSGWVRFLKEHYAAGGSILGLCGGYQMLGKVIKDPLNVEGSGSNEGIGLLPVQTTIAEAQCKIISPRQATIIPTMTKVEGFEIRCGRTKLMKDADESFRPLLEYEDGKTEGLYKDTVKGTYLHGILRSYEARKDLLLTRDDAKYVRDIPKGGIQDPLDRLAEHLTSCGLDYETVSSLINNGNSVGYI